MYLKNKLKIFFVRYKVVQLKGFADMSFLSSFVFMSGGTRQKKCQGTNIVYFYVL